MLASSTDRPDGVPRLDRARLLLEKLVDRLDNDKVGLVIFAGQSKMQLPLTSDFYTAKMYLNELNPGLITYQGTSIAEAIKMSMNGFSPGSESAAGEAPLTYMPSPAAAMSRARFSLSLVTTGCPIVR